MKVRILYRQIQEVPFDLWEKKLAIERACDEAERRAGHPVPRRYRQMFGANESHIRVSVREYESLADWARMTEEWMENEELQKLEAERHKYFTWEREELYYVDNDQPTPMWMTFIDEMNEKGEFDKPKFANKLLL